MVCTVYRHDETIRKPARGPAQKERVFDHDETRTRNLLIRSQTPYPLGHAVFGCRCSAKEGNESRRRTLPELRELAGRSIIAEPDLVQARCAASQVYMADGNGLHIGRLVFPPFFARNTTTYDTASKQLPPWPNG